MTPETRERGIEVKMDFDKVALFDFAAVNGSSHVDLNTQIVGEQEPIPPTLSCVYSH